MVSGDRRRFAREPCLISAWLRLGAKIYEGTLVNISNNGGYLATRRPVQEGTKVQVRFRHPWTDETVTARAVVMRRIASGARGGPEAGLGLALLDTLSDLEEEPDLTSGTFPKPEPVQTERLQAQALAAAKAKAAAEAKARAEAQIRAAEALRAASTPGSRIPTATTKRPQQMRAARFATPALKVLFFSSGRRDSMGTLSDISHSGLQVRCSDPPDKDRLVRLELVEGSGRPNLRIAGKVTWANPLPTDERPMGFGVRILHFLSAADEQRFGELLQELQIRSNQRVAKPL